MFQFDWLTLHRGNPGSIREPNADKLFYKDGAGLPPQGRTVRAAPRSPPRRGAASFVLPPSAADSRIGTFPVAPFNLFTLFVF
jgi:hypothetical protein